MKWWAELRHFFQAHDRKNNNKSKDVSMKVEKLIVDPEWDRLLVILSYANGERSSVFPMSLEENNSAMLAGIKVVKDLFLPLSRKFDLQLENVRFSRKEGGTEAEARWISKDKRQKIVTLSVIEALTLAIAAEIPVIMSEELLNTRSSSFPMSALEFDKKNPYYLRYSDNVGFDSEVIM